MLLDLSVDYWVRLYSLVGSDNLFETRTSLLYILTCYNLANIIHTHTPILSALETPGGTLDRTPPLEASARGFTSVVEALLDRRARINACDSLGETSLSLAAEHGQEDIARLLLGHGAAIESGDIEGRTPLSRAAEYGQEDIVHLFAGGLRPDCPGQG